MMEWLAWQPRWLFIRRERRRYVLVLFAFCFRVAFVAFFVSAFVSICDIAKSFLMAILLFCGAQITGMLYVTNW